MLSMRAPRSPSTRREAKTLGRSYSTRSRCTTVRATANAEYEALRGKVIYKASSGEPVELTSLWEASPGSRAVLVCLTHFADLSSWELARNIKKVLPTLDGSGVPLVAVGLGSAANARAFARALSFPADRLFAVPDGALYDQLGFSSGFGAGLDVSPYLKLLPMLAGVGSPGTVQEVLRGYVGDRAAPPVFESPTPFDILGPGYQRPFELATLRLFNMAGILPQWSELCPPDLRLLTQQGGCLVLEGTQVVFKHVDSGILRFVDMGEVMRAALGVEVVDVATPAVTSSSPGSAVVRSAGSTGGASGAEPSPPPWS